MAALDTNLLVRLLVADEAEQLARVRTLLQDAIEREEPLFIPVSVFLELEWVLRSVYRIGKSDIVSTLSAVLSTAELIFESEAGIEWALHQYENTAADFSDCLHVALAEAAGHRPLWTFDRKAARIDGAQWLGS
jgi:predicted nucleic-acid-binding protein